MLAAERGLTEALAGRGLQVTLYSQRECCLVRVSRGEWSFAAPLRYQSLDSYDAGQSLARDVLNTIAQSTIYRAS